MVPAIRGFALHLGFCFISKNSVPATAALATQMSGALHACQCIALQVPRWENFEDYSSVGMTQLIQNIVPVIRNCDEHPGFAQASFLAALFKSSCFFSLLYSVCVQPSNALQDFILWLLALSFLGPSKVKFMKGFAYSSQRLSTPPPHIGRLHRVHRVIHVCLFCGTHALQSHTQLVVEQTVLQDHVWINRYVYIYM